MGWPLHYQASRPRSLLATDPFLTRCVAYLERKRIKETIWMRWALSLYFISTKLLWINKASLLVQWIVVFKLYAKKTWQLGISINSPKLCTKNIWRATIIWVNTWGAACQLIVHLTRHLWPKKTFIWQVRLGQNKNTKNLENYFWS